ncbi:Peptidase C1A, papain [Thermoplasmatales archaeon SCGC AB-539-N05]|nr:Peptidase C1A, papain [Thermoplasmatales archaeon SCGC AB-539-N05]
MTQFKRRLGLIVDDEPGDEPEITLSFGASSSVDWRSAGKVTSVKNQGSCGSCWAFGALGAIESQYKIKTGETLDLAEQHLVSCDTNNHGCQGGYLGKTLDFVKNTGVVDEEFFPYKASNYYCTHPEGNHPVTKISGYKRISGRETIKTSIETNGPVYTGFDVYQDFQNYNGGVYTHTWGARLGGHAVAIIGYKDNLIGNGGYWICKNSWGTGWGENGYFRIAYGQCNIENNIYEMTVIADDPSQSISVISPNGGENWEIGSKPTITWSSTGLTQFNIVEIELLKGNEDSSTITSGTFNDGSYTWTKFKDKAPTPGSNYKIKITYTGLLGKTSDESDGYFSIEGDSDPQSITIISPNDGEEWERGKTHITTWTSKNVESSLKIDLYKGGIYSRIITTETVNSGFYSWIVPSSQTIGSDYTIKITSTSDSSVCDESDYFSIMESQSSELKVEIKNPNEGGSYSNTNIDIYGTINSPSTTLPVFIKLFLDGTEQYQWGCNIIGSGMWGHYTLDTTHLSNGEHNLTATATYDSASGKVTAQDTVNFTVNNDGPPENLNVEITYPTEGEVTKGDIQISGSVITETSATIRIFIDNQQKAEFDNINGLWSVSFNTNTEDVADGKHTIVAEATINDGDITATASVNFMVDNSPPELNIIKPKTGYLYTKNSEIKTLLGNTIIIGSITIEADVSDEISGVEKVEFYIDDELKHIASDAPYEWTLNEPLFGKHTIKVIAHDNLDNIINYEIEEVYIFSLGK